MWIESGQKFLFCFLTYAYISLFNYFYTSFERKSNIPEYYHYLHVLFVYTDKSAGSVLKYFGVMVWIEALFQISLAFYAITFACEKLTYTAKQR